MSRTTTTDVCDFLGKALRELADSDATPEELQAIIERAKASAAIAQAYTGIARVQLDAVKLAQETGYMAETVPVLPAPKGG